MPQPMATDLDVVEVQKSNIAKSAAETLLRLFNMNGGGTHIYVRVPLAFVNAGDAAQLGLAGTASEDVLLAPCVILSKVNDAAKKELLISSGALLRAREIRDAKAARDFFESAIGVVLGTQLLRIVSVEHEEIGGEAFLYRVICSI
jgi:hypothetical protein